MILATTSTRRAPSTSRGRFFEACPTSQVRRADEVGQLSFTGKSVFSEHQTTGKKGYNMIHLQYFTRLVQDSMISYHFITHNYESYFI